MKTKLIKLIEEKEKILNKTWNHDKGTFDLSKKDRLKWDELHKLIEKELGK